MVEPQRSTGPVILIPAYQPNAALLGLVLETAALAPDLDIVVVDDGSTLPASRRVFARLERMRGVRVLRHRANRGKGAALKTGLAYALWEWKGASAIVTADADGQHLARDIVRVAEAARQAPRGAALVLGARSFSWEGAPLRSRFGNTLTRALFAAFAGQAVTDTQTGLRAVSRPLAQASLSIPDDGYAFEFAQLFLARRFGAIAEVPVTRVYEEGNPTSHFRPVRDSLRIYAVFLRRLAPSLPFGRRAAAGRDAALAPDAPAL